MNNKGLLLTFIVFVAHEGIIITKNTETRNFSFYEKRALEKSSFNQMTNTFIYPSTDPFTIGCAVIGGYSAGCALSGTKPNLAYIATTAGIAGLLLTSPALIALWNYKRTSSPAWLKQIKQLKKEDFRKDPVLIGQNAYLVSKEFGNTEFAHSDNRYELYFMPNTEQLVDVYKAIIEALEQNPAMKKYVDFVALRLTPYTSYSHGKPLPNILVRLSKFASFALQDTIAANSVLVLLYNATNGYTGSGIHPRYSSPLPEVNNLIYTAFGSGDAKELHPNNFERKGPPLWRAYDDRAYKKGMTPLSLE
jgi:hypothetical protein